MQGYRAVSRGVSVCKTLNVARPGRVCSTRPTHEYRTRQIFLKFLAQREGRIAAPWRLNRHDQYRTALSLRFDVLH
jgi:hypothetical protein